MSESTKGKGTLGQDGDPEQREIRGKKSRYFKEIADLIDAQFEDRPVDARVVSEPQELEAILQESLRTGRMALQISPRPNGSALVEMHQMAQRFERDGVNINVASRGKYPSP